MIDVFKKIKLALFLTFSFRQNQVLLHVAGEFVF